MRWYFLIFLCTAFPALAGDQPTIKSGIRTLTITPPAVADKPVVADETDAATLQKPAIQVTGDGESPPYIADMDSTVKWPHLRGLLLPPETAEFQAALAALRENPAGVSPQGLLYGATALVNSGKLRDAALYQQAALLRTAFDAR